ncbi:hypothetical protein C4565_10140 [Candidatus Parcubacteria bacterium]|nr:MAG: hypothetical protein C4565_10140 [Candidatus Parcubacteria bacterium]
MFFLWQANLPRQARCRQWWLPIFASLFSFFALYYVLASYQEVQNVINSGIVRVEHLTGYSVKSFIPITVNDFPLLLNLFLLFIFAVIKWLWRLGLWVLSFFQRIVACIARFFFKRDYTPSPGKQNLFPAYVYLIDKGITLRDEWVYPGALALGFGWVSLGLLLFSFVNGFASQPLSIEIYHLPVIPLLILFETAWYLGGLRLSENIGELGGEDTSSRMKGEFGILWETYKNLWPDRILVSSDRLDVRRTVVPSPEVGNSNDMSPFEQVKRNLTKAGIYLDARQETLYEWLRNGGDTLIIESRYVQSVPVIFATLQQTIIEGGRIVFLLPSQSGQAAKEQILSWVQEWMECPSVGMVFFSIASFETLSNDSNILLITVDEILVDDIRIKSQWFNGVRNVVVLNLEETLLPEISRSALLFQRLANFCQGKIQYILLTAASDRDNLESSMRRFLGYDPREFRFDQPIPTEICYIIWREEGRGTFQEKVVHAARYLGCEAPLLIPALQDEISPIIYCGMARKPWLEHLEEIAKSLTGSPPGESIRNLVTPYLSRAEERAFVIVYDQNANLASTLKSVLTLGECATFLQVVSPSYLLRDYFADNLSFFLSWSETAGLCLAAVPALDRTTLARRLLDRLILSGMNEEQLLHQLDQLNACNKDSEMGGHKAFTEKMMLEDQLAGLLQDVCGLDVIKTSLLQVKEEYYFDSRSNQFVRRSKFSVGTSALERVQESGGRIYRILDDKDNLLGLLPEDHVYQNYLIGQIHAFQGKPFRIEQISRPDIGTIKTSHRPDKAATLYRRLLSVKLDTATIIEQFKLKMANGIRISCFRYEADFSIETLGYLSFENGMDFNNFEFIEHKGTKSESLDPVRQRPKGRLMSLVITPPPIFSNIAEWTRPAFTLAFLLQEMLQSIFPEIWQYGLVTTNMRPKKDQADLNERISTLVFPVEQRGEIFQPFDDKDLHILFIEDSLLDVGFVRAVWENWQWLLEIVEDYLVWFHGRGEQDNHNTYLMFNTGRLPQWLSHEELGHLLGGILDGHPHTLRKARQNFNLGIPELAATNSRVCDFCAEALSSSSFERLDDGRERCPSCKQTAVDTPEQLRQIYQDARKLLVRHCGVKLRQNVDIKFTTTNELHREIDEQFIPTPGFDPRSVGFARQRNGLCDIYIENGQPYHMTLATIVHELTHLWQYDNLDCKDLKKQNGLLFIEGLAVWAETELLQKQGVGISYCRQQRERSDIYGQGYRAIAELVRKSKGQNPFAILEANFPK